MKTHPSPYAVLILSLAFLLGACNLNAPPIQPTITSGPNPEHTAAAETIVAQLTQLAPSPTLGTGAGSPGATLPPTPTSILTLPPSQTPLPSDTSTPTVSPTATLSPTPTLQPAATVTPTATTVPGDPRASLGAPDWQDNFTDGTNWPLYNDEHVEMAITANGLEMTALNADKWESWMLTGAVLEDFYMEAIAAPGTCAGLDRYGVMVRAPSANEGYLFGLTCDGQYALRAWDGEGFQMLTSWTRDASIQTGTGARNRLGFWAEGDTLRIYANGSLLQEVQDSTFDAGQIGLFSGAFLTEGFTVTFSEVTYWNLP